MKEHKIGEIFECNDCECSVCILNPYKTNEENERR